MNLRGRGFTLIEVLVAMAVFAFLASIAYAALGATLNNADLLNARMDRLQALQRTMRYLANDFAHASPRPVRNNLGTGAPQPAIDISPTNDFALSITHGGWPNPAGLPRGTLQRSSYVLRDDTLTRVHFPVLDATYSTVGITTELVDGVESIEFRMFDSVGAVSNVWPPIGASGGAGLAARPRAVEIVLTLENEGEIRRIVEIAP